MKRSEIWPEGERERVLTLVPLVVARRFEQRARGVREVRTLLHSAVREGYRPTHGVHQHGVCSHYCCLSEVPARSLWQLLPMVLAVLLVVLLLLGRRRGVGVGVWIG